MGAKLNFNAEHILNEILSEQDRIIWESMGLTPDIQSMENAALLTKVFIDTLHTHIHVHEYFQTARSF